MPKSQKDMIYLIGVPRPKGILLSLVEIWVQSLLADCNKVPNTKMVFQVRPHQDCREWKCSFGGAWNGDFPPAAETKPSSFPFKYHVAKSYEICLLSCPSRSFLASRISRFWTPLEYLCFPLISTVVFSFLSGILASWGWSRFLTYSSYVCFCDLGGLSPSPHFITHG